MAAEGATPVLIEDHPPALPGAGVIAEYLDETRGLGLGDRRLLPDDPAGRAEARRLMAWFNVKFFNEASQWIVREKIAKRFMSAAQGGGGPDMQAVRAARSNVRYHLRYVGHLIRSRNWLAGDRLTYADLAAAAHLSCLDYLGDVPWDENETARNLVCAGEIASLVPSAPGRPPAGHGAERNLRRSGFLESQRRRPPEREGAAPTGVSAAWGLRSRKPTAQPRRRARSFSQSAGRSPRGESRRDCRGAIEIEVFRIDRLLVDGLIDLGAQVLHPVVPLRARPVVPHGFDVDRAGDVG